MARRPREEYSSILSAADNASAQVSAKNTRLLSTPRQNKVASRAVYFNRREAIGGLGRSLKEIN